jgi:hypothetical protein
MPATPREQLLPTLHDGYLCRLSFDLDADVKLNVISFKPPALMGPGPIEQTTMENLNYHTQAPGALLKVGDMTCKVAYAPALFADIKAMMLINQKIDWLWPNNVSGRVWGWIENFEPDELAINQRPTASLLIHISNLDTTTTAAGVEIAPVFVVTP